MKKKELSRGQYRVYLDRYEYRTLLHNARRPVTALVVRLAGEAGLKISEIMDVELQHVERSEIAPDKYLLYIPRKDDDDDLDYVKGRPRHAYIHSGLHEYMQEYAEAEDLNHDEKLVQVVKRSAQGYVKDAAAAAAEETGKDDFELVSSLDLRVFFAKQAIERWRIHPKVVMEVGGWKDLQTLLEHLDEATETKIIREFELVEFQGMDDWMSDVGPLPEPDEN